MKKLLLRLLFFTFPFIILTFAELWVDPYNYFYYDSQQTETKKNISGKVNYALWKLIEYHRDPKPNILLGDSQMGRLKSEDISNITGEDYYNFSYGGGTLREMINTFWFAAENTNLKNAYFGISFNHFNSYNDAKDRVNCAREIIRNPLLYLVNRNTLSATIYLLSNEITENETQIERPPMSRENFWDYNLNVPTHRYYANYKYPNGLYEELQSITEFCRKNDIDIKILILPTHAQLQDKVGEYGLSLEYETYIRYLSKLAVVYDFNIKNKWTEDRNNFEDPRHFKSRLAQEIIREIWGRKKTWVRISSKGKISNPIAF